MNLNAYGKWTYIMHIKEAFDKMPFAQHTYQYGWLSINELEKEYGTYCLLYVYHMKHGEVTLILK